MEPWLDSLSEDWDSQPRSSPQASLRGSTSTRSIHSRAGPSQSRIPRPKSSSKPYNSSSPLGGQSVGLKRRKVLTERSSSEVNALRHVSTCSAEAKIPSSLRLSRSSSASSVVRKSSPPLTERKSRSASPPKQKKSQTPEWKRLIMRDGNGIAPRSDLFTPIGLEGIFIKPAEKPASSSPERGEGSSALQDFEDIPSSPPPLPSNYLTSLLRSTSTKRWENYQTLEVVVEQDEDAAERPQRPHSRIDPETEISREIQPDENEHTESDLPRYALQRQEMDCDDVPIGHDKRERSPSELAHGSQSKLSSGDDVLGAKSNSSLSSGLSPVYISKHNTVGGGINYAALDMSNPETMMQLQQASLQKVIESRSASWQTAIKDESTNSIQFATPEQKVNLVPINGFVSVERGGHSDDDSFKRRPLSPSIPLSDPPSDSLAPSDSASQAASQSRLNARASAVKHITETDLTDGRQTPDPSTPQAKVAHDEISVIPELENHELPSSPLKLFDNHDTFTNDQLLRRIGQLDISSLESFAHNLTCRLRDRGSNVTKKQVYREILRGAQQPSSVGEGPADENLATAVEHHLIQAMGGGTNENPDLIEDTSYFHNQELALIKRSPPTPIDQSIPKRQRTICRLDAIPDTRHGSVTEVDQDRQASRLIGKKRKDARNGGSSEICDPDQLAKRPILTPRQLSSAGHRNMYTDFYDTSGKFTLDEAQLDTIQEHMDGIDFSVSQTYEEEIPKPGAEINSSRGNQHIDLNGSVRKQSVSTQDYVVEAMKIMEAIRSTRKPESEVSTFKESFDENMTPQTISRAPSREGPAVAWRDRNQGPLAENVLHHLKQFAENVDESFAISSASRSLHLKENEAFADEDEDSFESELQDVRILDQHLIENYTLDDREKVLSKEEFEQRQIKTHSSQSSSDSTGRTFKTNSSQKARNVATISPDKVSHLIQMEQAGMRFDTEKQIWIRRKAERASNNLVENLSSSTGTEDDPFGDIPNLDVDEARERDRPQSFDASTISRPGKEKKSHQPENIFKEGPLHTKQPPASENKLDSDHQDQQLFQTQGSNGVTMAEQRLLNQLNERNGEAETDPIEILSSHTPVTTPPLHSVRKRLPSIRPSLRSSLQTRCLSNALKSSQLSLQLCDDWLRSSDTDTRHRDLVDDRKGSIKDQYDHYMAVSCIDEHQEISFLETRPDGRSFSLTLSMSTPIAPSDRRVSFGRSNALRSGRRLFSLSPLSEFTVHQDDHRHLQSRNLLGGNNAIQIKDKCVQSSTTVSKLVDELMEVHSVDDMDWDMTRFLTLHDKSLNSLLMLDELCPNLEYVDVSWNQLRHVEGIPSAVRQLDIRQNLLSSLTDWAHLKNLQYLDISGNEIDSLEALNCLIHLRELKADDNRIMDFQGLFDLDGLLHLSVKRNQLQYVGLHGANLWRLAKLDLRENFIEEVNGLSSLRCLEELYLSSNSLERFDCLDERYEKDTMELRTLWINDNKLEELDVSAFPKLRVLVADNNSLSRIGGMQCLSNIDVVSIRSQKHIHERAFGLHIHFNEFAEVRHLYVSDNKLPFLDMTSSFLNLQTLEIAMTGLKYFPKNFGMLAPNLRTLNASSNSLRDLRPLNGILRLQTLLVAGNRIRRLRDTALKVNQISALQELDLRGNPFCMRFYPVMGTNSTTEKSLVHVQHQSREDTTATKEVGLLDLQHVLPPADRRQDDNFAKRLEDDTRFRRKVYELLLATRCYKLAKLDGLDFEYGQVLRRDSVWRHLTQGGCIEKSTKASVG